MPTVTQLIEQCRAQGIAYSGMRKGELEAALRDFDRTKTNKRFRLVVVKGGDDYGDPYAELAANIENKKKNNTNHGTGWNGAGAPSVKQTQSNYPDYADVAAKKRGGTGWGGAGAPKLSKRAVVEDDDEDLFQTAEVSKPTGYHGRGAPTQSRKLAELEDDDDLFQTQEASRPSGLKGRGAPKTIKQQSRSPMRTRSWGGHTASFEL